VIKRLMRGWSPEQIAGRLKHAAYPNDPSLHICHETIYRFIYHPDQKLRSWWEYLRRGQKKRRKKGGRKRQRCRIPDRVSIHQRPERVDKREEFGHWEGDTVVGKGRDHGLHTTYERVSSLYRFALMESFTADASYKAQKRIYTSYPKPARKSTTLDNGLEHAKHKKVEKETGIKAYFADPYSAWQRGGNENGNLWLRYYFPKGTDFRTIPREELKAVEWELNNRPRKRLGFKTPQEVFNEKLKGCNRS
jgi:IS30 family transposase